MPKAKSKQPDAIELLKQDHHYVKQALRRFARMDHDDHEALQGLVEQVCDALKMHTRVEEEIFYPALRKALDDGELIEEAEVEHDSAKALIRRLEKMRPGDPKYAATFKVLGEYVKHHVKEEESEIFPKARRGKMNIQALGKRIMERKARH
jgi:hemerythrin-like domain-containing protein